MKKSIKLLSTLIAILFCVQVIPALSYKIMAADMGFIKPNVETVENEAEPASILYEDESKRGENEKHFVMSDGTINAVIFSEPVHYLSSDGAWKDIDNTLVYDGADKESDFDFDGYAAKGSSMNVKLAEDLDDGVLFRIEDEEGEIVFLTENKRDGASSESVKIEVKEAPEGDERNIYADYVKTHSEAIYKDAFCGADLSYGLTPGSLKVEIIIKEEAEKYEYSFVMKANGFVPVVMEDGSVGIRKPGRMKTNT
ncbi:MAG: hypothetical protein IKN38_10510 [Clostridia bacterium]|nr:hypothetical protein [Clostridia bacterium]